MLLTIPTITNSLLLRLPFPNHNFLSSTLYKLYPSSKIPSSTEYSVLHNYESHHYLPTIARWIQLNCSCSSILNPTLTPWIISNFLLMRFRNTTAFTWNMSRLLRKPRAQDGTFSLGNLFLSKTLSGICRTTDHNHCVVRGFKVVASYGWPN